MALVSYSDSEGSETESTTPSLKQTSKSAKPQPSGFAVDRSKPGKIRVNLQEQTTDANGNHDDEPAAKRPRVGGGAFSNFSAMLPAPKKPASDATNNQNARGSARKVFSLRTGAEPAFSREADAELRQLFDEEGANQRHATNEDKINNDRPQSMLLTDGATIASTEPGSTPNLFMFKPLSVARNTKKKKPATSAPMSVSATKPIERQPPSAASAEPVPRQKVSLFSAHVEEEALEPKVQPVYHKEDPIDDGYDDEQQEIRQQENSMASHTDSNTAQSLEAIASDLRLSAADRRQLFGRSAKSGTAVNVVNFNTDQEYAANEELRAAGEQVQHNPVRGIAPGKHSLRQLMNSAVNQKDALEESFATGRRNKKEAGNKYGW